MLAEEEQEDLMVSLLCHTAPRAFLPPVPSTGFPLTYLVGEWSEQGHVGPEVTTSQSLEADVKC